MKNRKKSLRETIRDQFPNDWGLVVALAIGGAVMIGVIRSNLTVYIVFGGFILVMMIHGWFKHRRQKQGEQERPREKPSYGGNHE